MDTAVVAALVKSSRSRTVRKFYYVYIIMLYIIHITRDCLLNIYKSITIFCD